MVEDTWSTGGMYMKRWEYTHEHLVVDAMKSGSTYKNSWEWIHKAMERLQWKLVAYTTCVGSACNKRKERIYGNQKMIKGKQKNKI